MMTTLGGNNRLLILPCICSQSMYVVDQAGVAYTVCSVSHKYRVVTHGLIVVKGDVDHDSCC